MASRRTAASQEDEIAQMIMLKARKHALRGEFYIEDPEDLSQELWIKSNELRKLYDGDRGALIAFLDVALNNHLKNLAAARRAQKRGGPGDVKGTEITPKRTPTPYRPPESLSDLDPEDDVAEFDMERAAMRIDVQRALGKLRPEQRDLALRRIHERVTEIAEEMGVSRETVYQWLREIRRIFEDFGLSEYFQ